MNLMTPREKTEKIIMMGVWKKKIPNILVLMARIWACLLRQTIAMARMITRILELVY